MFFESYLIPIKSYGYFGTPIRCLFTITISIMFSNSNSNVLKYSSYQPVVIMNTKYKKNHSQTQQEQQQNEHNKHNNNTNNTTTSANSRSTIKESSSPSPCHSDSKETTTCPLLPLRVLLRTTTLLLLASALL